MHTHEAATMIKALLASQRSLDQALELASQISVASEREQLENSLHRVITTIYMETIRKIAIQHPALDPDKDDK